MIDTTKRNLLRRASWLLAVMVVAACSPEKPRSQAVQDDQATGSAAVASPAAHTYVYTCSEDTRFTARFEPDMAILKFPDRELRLPQVVSGSGARYSDGKTTFWIKGDEATLETDGKTTLNCRGVAAGTPWEEARLRGVAFRAVGQEPGWVLEIDATQITFIGDYGERRVRMPAPAPARDPRTGSTTYQAETDGHALNVTITEAPCADSMSGESFPTTVSVTLDGTTYQGCGRPLAETKTP